MDAAQNTRQHGLLPKTLNAGPSGELEGTLRWGVVGTGHISNQMASDFSLIEGGSVVAVTSRSLSSANDFGDKFGIPKRFDDYELMLRSDIDAVYIGTPHVTHFELAQQALEHGIHVLCEKPIGLNASEVRQLATIARRTGAFLMEAMWMKFNPLHRRLLEIVNSGAIGEVRSVRGSFGAPFPEDGSSRWKPGGSTLLDQGIYPVTLGWMFLGKPTHIVAAGVMRQDGVDLRENFTLGYPDGRFAQGAASMTEFLDMSASISGTLGWITLDTGFWYACQATLHRNTADGPVQEPILTEREGNGYVPMLREVTAAIRNGEREHHLHTLDETALVFDCLDEIRRQISPSG
jgi:predicted dehydrogenase